MLTEEIHLFARMAITDSSAIIQLITATASATGKPETVLWKALLDQYWQRVRFLAAEYTIRPP